MKDYDIVVKERYDKEQIGGEKTISNVYSMFNNTGFCGAMNEYALLRKIIRFITVKTCKLPSELRLLDVGCGKGVVTRMLSELVESPQNIFGTELSANRIAHCKKMNGSIDVRYADITRPLPFDFSFDCAFSFDVLMHLKTKEQVEAALNNIYSNIDGRGYLLWYDPNVHSHFDDADNDSDGT
ncbi:MAG: class I SAM-dependent methyltransferase [Treponema sp.]|nr:class I SAM-dependent methyltransferase [Treponema sp.]